MSTIAASLTHFEFTTSSYGMSKAALNFAALQLNVELKDKGFTIIALHPGAVSTKGVLDAAEKLGYREYFLANSITTEVSTTGIVKLVEGLKHEDSGKFIDYKGDLLPL
ncbi:uncharacterized protein RJT21DRAFT_121795 [Scheffersomyces amazonensis]|uniref:uncharacterized protein n=1 Tax=Scheffersomyces amazonensis TaxID=1078765 RepID=UPI00315D5C9C